jgi:peptide/nickel transport system ATP-binding protein
MNVLDIKNLNFGFNKTELIYKNFNLTLTKGNLISIVGASGSGKSTLFNLIVNELKPISGDISSMKISQVYQDPYSSFHDTYSIINQISDVASFDIEDLKTLCGKINIPISLLDKKPYNISGGQLQRCSILRALLMKPKLLLADEPTSALDNITSIMVMKFILSCLEDIGVLLITHDIKLANWCSDKIIKID